MLPDAIACATVPTAHASRYLQQLCKHWSHRFETEFDAEHGRVNFGTGAAHFTAAPGALGLTVLASDLAGLERLEGAVAGHLQRFAFREDLSVDWRRS